MGAAAVGTSLGAEVGRGRRDAEPALRECVLDPQLERERIAGLRIEHVLHDDTAPVVFGRPPGSVADEPVDGVSALGLGERQLMTTPVELVRAVLNAVRPRNEHLPPPGRRQLVDARSRRARSGLPPSTCEGRRRPRRRPPSAGPARSRTARRKGGPWLPRLWVEGLRARPSAGDDEGPQTHRGGDDCGERVDRRELDAAVQERADAERRDPVPELVEGDHAAGRRGREGGQLLLAEADRERQERRAPEPCEAEGENAERGLVIGEQPDEHERPGEHERQHVVRQPGGNDALDGGEDDAPDGHHPPERRQRQRGLRRRSAELARHVELRPVAVDGLADAVEDGEARVHPEPSRDREPRGRRRGTR